MGICIGKSAKLAHVSSGHLSVSDNKGTFSDLKSYSVDDLKIVTRNFSKDTLIGEGRFGCVFKGWIDEHTYAPCRPGTGLVVAVKKLESRYFPSHEEWLAEVNYLGLQRHENLVKLIGYCSDAENNKLLVYEYMPKGSLENHLFKKGVPLMNWSTRMHIALDIARGLTFLQSLDPNVIYRDLKPSNILLDSESNAKLSDVGPKGDKSRGRETWNVARIVVHTRFGAGHAAPEYEATGHLTPKFDVYCFGVVLLELLSGRRAPDDDEVSGAEEPLVDWAKSLLSDNRKTLRIMDSRLGGQYSEKSARLAGAIALKCLRMVPELRPSMTEVLADLEKLQVSKDVSRLSHRGNREIVLREKMSVCKSVRNVKQYR